MNNNQKAAPDNKAAEAFLRAAAKKLGCSPQALAAQIENGGLEQTLRSQSDPKLRAAANLLSDPKALDKLKSDPNAQALMKKLGGK